MNNVSFYFRETINTKEFAEKTLKKLLINAAEKYVACAVDFKLYHQKTGLKDKTDLILAQIVYIVIRAFFKYLVCNVKDPVIKKAEYHDFFKESLTSFILKFGARKNLFRDVHRILSKKQEKLRDEKNKI